MEKIIKKYYPKAVDFKFKNSEDGKILIFNFKGKKFIGKYCYKFDKNRLRRFDNFLKLYFNFLKNSDRIGFYIPKFFDKIHSKGIFICEFIEGEDLKSLLVKNFNDKSLFKIFYQVGENLYKFHNFYKKKDKFLSFGDFRIWNIIKKKDNFYLIDFPDEKKYFEEYRDIAEFLNSVYLEYIRPQNLFKKKLNFKKLQIAFLKGYFKKDFIKIDYFKLFLYKRDNFLNAINLHPIFKNGKNFLKEIFIYLYLSFFYRYEILRLKNELSKKIK